MISKWYLTESIIFYAIGLKIKFWLKSSKIELWLYSNSLIIAIISILLWYPSIEYFPSILTGVTLPTCDEDLGVGKYVCEKDLGENPFFGYINYDNIFWGFLSGLSLVTIDFWEYQYYYVCKNVH